MLSLNVFGHESSCISIHHTNSCFFHIIICGCQGWVQEVVPQEFINTVVKKDQIKSLKRSKKKSQHFADNEFWLCKIKPQTTLLRCVIQNRYFSAWGSVQAINTTHRICRVILFGEENGNLQAHLKYMQGGDNFINKGYSSTYLQINPPSIKLCNLAMQVEDHLKWIWKSIQIYTLLYDWLLSTHEELFIERTNLKWQLSWSFFYF